MAKGKKSSQKAITQFVQSQSGESGESSSSAQQSQSQSSGVVSSPQSSSAVASSVQNPQNVTPVQQRQKIPSPQSGASSSSSSIGSQKSSSSSPNTPVQTSTQQAPVASVNTPTPVQISTQQSPVLSVNTAIQSSSNTPVQISTKQSPVPSVNTAIQSSTNTPVQTNVTIQQNVQIPSTQNLPVVNIQEKMFEPSQFIGPKLDLPYTKNILPSQQAVSQIIQGALQKIKNQPNSGKYFSKIITKLQNLSEKKFVTRGLATGLTVANRLDEYNDIIDEYEQIWDSLTSSYEATDNILQVQNVRSSSTIDQQIKDWNDFVMIRVENKVPVTENMIPQKLLRIAPPEYLQNLNSYNSSLQFSSISGNFAVNGLLFGLTAPQYNPIQKIVAPSGFSEVGVDVFFKRLESELKNNYSDLMGEYRVYGASDPCRLFMDKNYNFVVTQGDKRRVFKNVQEARLFCLKGGYEADKVKLLRQKGMVIDKLKQPKRYLLSTVS